MIRTFSLSLSFCFSSSSFFFRARSLKEIKIHIFELKNKQQYGGIDEENNTRYGKKHIAVLKFFKTMFDKS